MGIYPHRHTRCGCGGRPAREEVNDADRGARSTLVNLLIPRLIEVLGLSESVLDAASQPGAPGGMSGLRAAALHAALAWLRAGTGPNLHSPLTPPHLQLKGRRLNSRTVSKAPLVSNAHLTTTFT